MAFIACIIFGALSLAYAMPLWFGRPWYELVNRVFVVSVIALIGLYIYQTRTAQPTQSKDDLMSETWAWIKRILSKKDTPLH